MDATWREADLPPDVEATSALVLDVAYRLHRAVGPGFREATYRRFLVHGLRSAGARVAEEVWIPLEFDGLHVPRAVRADLVVNGHVLVELKSVEALHPVHRAQIVSYLRASGIPMGLLVNFNVRLLKSGVERFVHPRHLGRMPAESP